MNREDYKKAFSNVRPSEKTVERIFEMSEKKNRKFRFKGLIAVLACLMALLCGTLTANAATNGALFEGIHLIMNGEDVNIVDYLKEHKSYVGEDGEQVEEYVLDVPDENGDGAVVFEKSVSDEEQN